MPWTHMKIRGQLSGIIQKMKRIISSAKSESGKQGLLRERGQLSRGGTQWQSVCPAALDSIPSTA